MLHVKYHLTLATRLPILLRAWGSSLGRNCLKPTLGPLCYTGDDHVHKWPQLGRRRYQRQEPDVHGGWQACL